MPRYDAFLSYSHAADGVFGPRLQALLEGFARTGPRRAVRIFRDEQNLAADPDLWGSIEQALTDSEWFVLLASPDAARSDWVDKEVAWWLAHRPADRLIIARTEAGPDGELPLPPVLRAPGAPRPAVVDLTPIARSRTGLDRGDPMVQRKVAELAGSLHGRPAPDLLAADAAHRRRERTSALGAVAVLAALLVLALVGGAMADAETTRADAETRVATAHLLAATALATSATDLEQAALLAVEGYRLHPDTQTLTALLRSVSRSSPIGARAVLDDDVVVIAAAPEAGAVVIGTDTGEILRWDLRGAPVRLTTLDARPSALATSQDGTVVAVATVGEDAGVWVYAEHRRRKVLEGDAVDVAVDPTGTRFATVRWEEGQHEVSVRTTADHTVVADADLARTVYDSVRLQDDAVVLHQRRTNQGVGPWQRRSLPDLGVLDEGRVLGEALAEDIGRATVTAQAVTADGGWVMSHLDDTVHATRTTDGAVTSAPVPTALGTFPPAVMALSPGARRVLLSRRDEVWVVQLPVAGTEHRAERLEGIGTPDAAVFLDDDLLVMTHGATLTAWEVGSADALAETSAGTGTEQRLGPALVRDLGRLPPTTGDQLLPVPLADGTHLFVDARTGAVHEAAGASAGSAGRGGGGVGEPALEPRYETGLAQILDAATDRAGRLVLAAADGTVRVIDPSSGAPLHETSTSAEPGTETRSARISPDGAVVAFHDADTPQDGAPTALVRVVEVSTGAVRAQRLTAGRLSSRGNDWSWQSSVAFAFGDDYLAIAHSGGLAILDRDGGSVRLEIEAPASGRQNAAAPVPGTTLVALAGDADWIRLFDTITGEEVGDLSALAGAADGDAPLWLAAGQRSLWAVGPRHTTRWDLRPARLHAQACRFAARDLTADEWRATTGGEPPADLACDRPLAAP